MSEKNPVSVSLFNSAFAIMQRDIFIHVINILTGVVIARTPGPEFLGIWVLLTLVSGSAEGFGSLITKVFSQTN